MSQPFYVLTIVLCVVISVGLLRSIVLRSRRLNRRITEFKAEMEERQKRGIPFNPYLELSQLYQEEEDSKTKRKRRK
ncbi:hypothetical protein LBMAG21_10440 [Armatimonadota bacterium]|nr:hypothetical protein LBMAG21_10440 [Armatimonadota bacterium]